MRDIQTLAVACPNCEGTHVTCKFNHFEQGELEIHSWEHKCLDCGRRETTAYRSDDEDLDIPREEQSVCPYCKRRPSST